MWLRLRPRAPAPPGHRRRPGRYGGAVPFARLLRIFVVAGGARTKHRRTIVPPQCGQAKPSFPKTRARSSAHPGFSVTIRIEALFLSFFAARAAAASGASGFGRRITSRRHAAFAASTPRKVIWFKRGGGTIAASRPQGEEPPTAPRHREHPLSRRGVRGHTVRPPRGPFRHPSPTARGAEAAALAGKGHDPMVVAAFTSEPRKPVCGIAAAEEALELALHMARERPPHLRQRGAQAREPLADDRVQLVVQRTAKLEDGGHRRGMARAVPRKTGRSSVRRGARGDERSTPVDGHSSAQRRQGATAHGTPTGHNAVPSGPFSSAVIRPRPPQEPRLPPPQPRSILHPRDPPIDSRRLHHLPRPPVGATPTGIRTIQASTAIPRWSGAWGGALVPPPSASTPCSSLRVPGSPPSRAAPAHGRGPDRRRRRGPVAGTMQSRPPPLSTPPLPPPFPPPRPLLTSPAAAPHGTR